MCDLFEPPDIKGLMIFCLNLKFLGWPHSKSIKIAKMIACSENCHCGDDFDAVFTIFRSYRYGANASEAVDKITAEEKDYCK